MFMKEKYKYMFMRYIYNKLGLKQIENNLNVGGIKTLDLESDGISKYFRIVNEIDEDSLTGNLKEKYNYYFSLTIDELMKPELEHELAHFFESTYKILLFPKINSMYVHYGFFNDNYIAPRDSVVLGFYYNEFDLDDSDFDNIHFKNDTLIANNLNYIQSVLGPNAKMKVAVIKYNEFSVKNNLSK